jgi:hypothetical protein
MTFDQEDDEQLNSKFCISLYFIYKFKTVDYYVHPHPSYNQAIDK